MRILRLVLLPMLLVALAAGCGDDDSDVSSGDDGSGGSLDLDGKTYVSTSVTEDGADRPLVDGTQIQITFHDGALTAQAGCNSMGSAYELDGDVLVIEGDAMATTQIGCDDALQQQDEFLAAFLTGSPTMTVDGDTLTMATDTVTIELLDSEVATPDLPLVGTEWTVTGFFDEDSTNQFASEEPGTIIFGDDDNVSGNDGCNTFGGPYALSDDEETVDIGPVNATLIACEDIAEYTEAFGAILVDGVTVEIDGVTLTLTAPDGNGVIFVGAQE